MAAPPRATYDDLSPLLARDEAVELVDGEIVHKASPDPTHGHGQAKLSDAHYWIVDPAHQTLSVLRWHPDAYLLVLTAGRGDVVEAEPFPGVELSIDDLFGLA